MEQSVALEAMNEVAEVVTEETMMGNHQEGVMKVNPQGVVMNQEEVMKGNPQEVVMKVNPQEVAMKVNPQGVVMNQEVAINQETTMKPPLKEKLKTTLNKQKEAAIEVEAVTAEVTSEVEKEEITEVE